MGRVWQMKVVHRGFQMKGMQEDKGRIVPSGNSGNSRYHSDLDLN